MEKSILWESWRAAGSDKPDLAWRSEETQGNSKRSETGHKTT